jgi:hypothetical protein
VQAVLGVIDLDPASSPQAQQQVQATRFYTAHDNGLLRAWSGRVFLNPPYAQPLIAHFVTRLVEEVRCGHVTEAILLTHNSSATTWFHLAEAAARCLCFPKRRIQFIDPHGARCSPLQGQTFFYFGPTDSRFRDVFQAFGMIR